MFIDTHAHVNFNALRQQVLKRVATRFSKKQLAKMSKEKLASDLQQEFRISLIGDEFFVVYQTSNV